MRSMATVRTVDTGGYAMFLQKIEPIGYPHPSAQVQDSLFRLGHRF